MAVGRVHRRDYYPTSFVIRLRPGTTTTYIVTPELESILREQPFSRIRSLNDGKLDFAIDTPLQKDGRISGILSNDDRVERWHTAESAPTCDSHVNFITSRF